MMRTHLLAATAAAILFLTAASTYAQEPADPLLRKASTSRAKGQEDAAIFVYEFADFQCPHCARFALEVFPRIDSAFVKTGRVHWVFVNLPLPSHPRAWLAHEAAVCAGAVADRFWPVHDRLFAAQQEWANAPHVGTVIDRILGEAGVPADRVAQCIADDRVAAVLLQDVIFAATARVTGTPAFNVNNEHSVMGLKTFEQWRDLLEKTIKESAAKK